jgi:ankyrin
MRKRTPTTFLTILVWAWAAGPASGADARIAEAVKSRDVAGLRALIQQGESVSAPLADGATALHWAVHWDDEEAVDLLLGAGAPINARNDYGIAALSLACTNRNDTLVGRLLAAGADPNIATATGETALMTCSYTGNAAAVRALLQRGADVNARENIESQTALMWAAAQGHEDVLKSLLAAGADVGHRSRARQHFVCFTTQCGNTGFSRMNERAQKVVSRGAYTALLFAARRGDVESVRLLLDAGAPIEEQGGDGYTPLLMAAHSGHTQLTKFLLERGASPNASGAGYSPLHTAVLRGDLEMVNALIGAGAHLGSQISEPAPMERFTDKWMVLPLAVVGYTPFQLAAKYAEVPIMRALLRAGDDPNVASPDRMTALMAVAGVGMNRNGSTDRRGRTVDVALVTVTLGAEESVLEAVELLLQAGVDINAVNNTGDTALHGAAGLGLKKVFQYLVEHGANAEAPNKKGQSPRAILERGEAPN